MEQNREVREVKKAIYEPKPETDLTVSWKDSAGRPNQFTALRDMGEEGKFAQALVHHPETGEIIAGEVRLPERMEATKSVELTFVRRHKHGIEVAGAVVVAIAGVTGIVVRRLHQRHKN